MSEPLPEIIKDVQDKMRHWHMGARILQVLVLLFSIFILAVAGLALRLSHSPLDVSFAKPYIESSLSMPDRGIHGTVEHVVLHWPDLKGPIFLGFEDFKILNDADKPIIEIDEAALSLSYSRLLIGQVAPVALIIKNPSLYVIRKEDGSFDVGFKNAQNDHEDFSIVERVLEYIAKPGSQISPDSPFGSLKALEIQGAQVMLDDRIMDITWSFPKVDASLKSTDKGLEADFYADAPAETQQDSFAMMKMVFGWEKKDVTVLAELRNINSKILTEKIPSLAGMQKDNPVVNAKLAATLDANLMPIKADLELSSPGGMILIPSYSVDPVPFENFGLKLSYDGATGRLDIPSITVTARGVPVSAEGELMHTENHLEGPIQIKVDQIAQSQIGPLWPVSLKGDNSEEWIVQKMGDGTFHKVFANIFIDANKGEDGWHVDAKNVEAGFSFDNMSVDYRAPMIPVKNAKGRGLFDMGADKLRVDIESAMIGDLSVRKGRVQFVDILKEGQGKADVSVDLTGPLKTGFEYVSKEPINMKHKFDIQKVEGNIEATVDVKFPTHRDIKVEEVKVGVQGTLSDVLLPGVVKDLELTGGPLTMNVGDEEFVVKGEGKLSGRPVVLDYQEFLSSGGKPHKFSVKAKINVDPELRNHFGIDLSTFMEGPVAAEVTYTEMQDGRAEIDVAADLTETRVFATPFDYEKAAGQPGQAKFKALMNKDVLTDIQGLTGTAPQMEIKSTDMTFVQAGEETKLATGKVSNFVISETVGSLDFEFEPSGRVKINLQAPFLDMRPFLNSEPAGDEPYGQPPMQITVAADSMRAADGETLQYGKIYLDIDGEGNFNQMQFDAIAGKGDIVLRYMPDENGLRTFRFNAADAGATLRAFGLYPNMVGGTMSATATAKEKDSRNLNGSGEIKNFKIVKAPVLAKLLGALSLPGLLNLLGDEGITFSKLEADGEWDYKPDGSIVVFKNGRTSGNALGLTFEGTFDKMHNQIDVGGTIIPLSDINKIIGSIPLIGDILTGGSGGIFAATYSIKGPSSGPSVSVNPLAVLAPGILRRILFE